jgi:hypothetical protein
MSIFRDFFVKEKPVFTGITRGVGGFGFGGGGPSGPSFSASGGSKFSLSGYTYHVFISSGSFIVSGGSQDVELVAIGGGGSGGYFYGSGGGAGGACHATAFPVTPGTYTCTVGDGGTAPGGSQSVGDKGGDTEIYKGSPGPSTSNVYALGGGGGGYNGAPTPSDPWGPGGCPGGVNYPLSGLNSPFPSSYPQHPSVTKYSGDGGRGSGSDSQVGGGGGGIGGGGSTNVGGNGRAFSMLPGPGIYPLLPSSDQSTVGTAWRDTLGPTGLIGGGGNGYGNPVEPGTDVPARPGGGGSGGALAHKNGVVNTGSGGFGPGTGNSPGTGGKGLIVIRYQ